MLRLQLCFDDGCVMETEHFRFVNDDAIVIGGLLVLHNLTAIEKNFGLSKRRSGRGMGDF